MVNAEAGGRIELKLLEASPLRVDYRVVLSAGEQTWAGTAQLDTATGSVQGPTWAPEGAPAWLERMAHTTLRLVCRDHRENGAWPRRLCRWRPAPEQP